jgi:hypothetical protein
MTSADWVADKVEFELSIGFARNSRFLAPKTLF